LGAFVLEMAAGNADAEIWLKLKHSFGRQTAMAPSSGCASALISDEGCCCCSSHCNGTSVGVCWHGRVAKVSRAIGFCWVGMANCTVWVEFGGHFIRSSQAKTHRLLLLLPTIPDAIVLLCLLNSHLLHLDVVFAAELQVLQRGHTIVHQKLLRRQLVVAAHRTDEHPELGLQRNYLEYNGMRLSCHS
jgi:hypothetical protein